MCAGAKVLLHAMRSHNTDWVVQENGCTALRQLGGFEAQEGGAAEGYLDIIGHVELDDSFDQAEECMQDWRWVWVSVTAYGRRLFSSGGAHQGQSNHQTFFAIVRVISLSTIAWFVCTSIIWPAYDAAAGALWRRPAGQPNAAKAAPPAAAPAAPSGGGKAGKAEKAKAAAHAATDRDGLVPSVRRATPAEIAERAKKATKKAQRHHVRDRLTRRRRGLE